MLRAVLRNLPLLWLLVLGPCSRLFLLLCTQSSCVFECYFICLLMDLAFLSAPGPPGILLRFSSCQLPPLPPTTSPAPPKARTKHTNSTTHNTYAPLHALRRIATPTLPSTLPHHHLHDIRTMPFHSLRPRSPNHTNAVCEKVFGAWEESLSGGFLS